MKTETITNDGTIEISIGRNIVRQRPISEIDRKSVAGVAFDTAVAALETFQIEAHKTGVNPLLSNIGKQKNIDPFIENTALLLAKQYADVQSFKSQCEKRFALLVQVPALLPSDAVSASIDLEIRNWYRGLSVAERVDVLAKIEDGADFGRIEVALLRSPVAMADLDLKVIVASWQRARRAASPDEDGTITSGLEACEWAERGLLQVAAAFRSSIDSSLWTGQRLLNVIIACPNPTVQAGFAVFGFGVREAADTRRGLTQRVITPAQAFA